jgi:hypothetical protein
MYKSLFITIAYTIYNNIVLHTMYNNLCAKRNCLLQTDHECFIFHNKIVNYVWRKMLSKLRGRRKKFTIKLNSNSTNNCFYYSSLLIKRKKRKVHIKGEKIKLTRTQRGVYNNRLNKSRSFRRKMSISPGVLQFPFFSYFFGKEGKNNWIIYLNCPEI